MRRQQGPRQAGCCPLAGQKMARLHQRVFHNPTAPIVKTVCGHCICSVQCRERYVSISRSVILNLYEDDKPSSSALQRFLQHLLPMPHSESSKQWSSLCSSSLSGQYPGNSTEIETNSTHINILHDLDYSTTQNLRSSYFELDHEIVCSKNGI